MFDFHRHLNKSPRTNNAFYCTSTVEEWSANTPISLGLLFNDNKYTKTEIDELLTLMERKLIENNSYQIGEIGLDKRFGQIDLQSYFLQECIILSKKYNRILTIHCVKEYKTLIDLLEISKNKMGPITMVHGFTSSYEIAKQLRNFNILISLNSKFLKTKSFKSLKEFDNLGFLVESDWDLDNDDNYQSNFDNFILQLDQIGIKSYKEFNNEYRTIFKNISTYRR